MSYKGSLTYPCPYCYHPPGVRPIQFLYKRDLNNHIKLFHTKRMHLYTCPKGHRYFVLEEQKFCIVCYMKKSQSASEPTPLEEIKVKP